MSNPNIDTLYTLCSTKVITLNFNTNKDAVKYRLRLYNHRRSNAELPKLTIIVNGCELKAGPVGWDLVDLMIETSPQVAEELAAHEREQIEAEAKRWERTQQARESAIPTLADQQLAMFGKVRSKEEKAVDLADTMYEREGNKDKENKE